MVMTIYIDKCAQRQCRPIKLFKSMVGIDYNIDCVFMD